MRWLLKTRQVDSRFGVLQNGNGAGGWIPPAPKTADGPLLHLRLDRDFDYPVETAAKQLVGVHNFVQGKRVRDKRNKIQAAVTHKFHQPAHPLFSAGAKRCNDLLIGQARGKWL